MRLRGSTSESVPHRVLPLPLRQLTSYASDLVHKERGSIRQEEGKESPLVILIALPKRPILGVGALLAPRLSWLRYFGLLLSLLVLVLSLSRSSSFPLLPFSLNQCVGRSRGFTPSSVNKSTDFCRSAFTSATFCGSGSFKIRVQKLGKEYRYSL